MFRRHALSRVVSWGLLVASLGVATPALAAAPPPQVRAYIQVGPPRPVYERRLVSPGPGFVWVAGYHRWDGRAYEWVPGRWVRAPRAGSRWVAPQWRHDRRQGWYFIDGRWR
jgi:hypothetical protein